jgi:hypothetical protein
MPAERHPYLECRLAQHSTSNIQLLDPLALSLLYGLRGKDFFPKLHDFSLTPSSQAT